MNGTAMHAIYGIKSTCMYTLDGICMYVWYVRHPCAAS